ncbi:SOS response-associated peptidase [Kitasatospora sp. RB6PN24]|uniref:SOS response-associated peptidase n=1 Tax=Kitasatospora humi TaxID=2893891 RepID=UPI001E2C00E3|nr:SOS response-associated peptidase [Kitasatospora humi]MCC9307790.1 SOS response-associated peptidase [Kitasatospora humi]
MCGRFVSTSSPQDLVEIFDVQRWDPTETLDKSWNVAPTDPVWAVLERPVRKAGPEPVRQLRVARWGLVPSWAKDPSIGGRLINARAETVDTKPSFRRAFAARRCLLPGDGFYEWESLPPAGPGGRQRKQPYFITLANGRLLAMAGLYEFWHDPDLPKDDPESWLTSVAIITTRATDAAGRIHPRMPLTIEPEDAEQWLDPDQHDADRLRRLLVQPGAGHLIARPVSTAVNRTTTNGPQLVDEVEPLRP